MLPFRSGRSWKRTAGVTFFAVGIACFAAVGADPNSSPTTPSAKPKSSAVPAGVPLAIGHEAKGLVLPDYNLQGQLQARFEAAAAKRISDAEIEMTGLKVTTFTPENATDMTIEVPLSVLNLETRVITSHERTTVRRTDFEIAGDTLSFDTVARQGTFVGNVKMVIKDSGRLVGKPGE